MRRFCKVLGSILTVLFCLLLLSVGFGFDRLVDDRLRPWLATRAAEVLESEVSVQRLQLGWGWLALSGVRVERPGAFRLQVAEVAVRYSMAGFWRQQLESVAVRQPELDWEVAAATGDGMSDWPAAPPLLLGEWRIDRGRLSLGFGENRLLLYDLTAAGSLDRRFTADASALLGDAPGVPVVLTGNGRWEGQPELTVAEFRLSGQSVLQEPFTVSPGVESFGVQLALAQLGDREAARLLAAFGRQPPWPADLGWQVTAPRLLLGRHEGALSLHLESAAGEARLGEERWLWERLQLRLAGADETWAAQGELELPASSRLLVKGEWTDARFTGTWRLSAPLPAQLGQAMAAELPVAAEQLQDLAVSGEVAAAADSVVVSRVRLAARFRQGLELTGSLAGRWQAGAIGLEVFGISLRQDKHQLASTTMQLSRKTPQANWRGTWRLQVADGSRLAQALALEVPDGLPNVQDVELFGDLSVVDQHLRLPAIELSGHLAGTGLGGIVSGQLAVRQLSAGWRIELAQLALKHLEYLSPDGLAGVAGGSAQITGSLDLRENLAFALKAQAAAEEALAGNWYADLHGIPLNVELAGVWATESGDIQLHGGYFDLAGVATAQLQGSYSGRQWQLQGEVSVPQLSGPFQLRLRQLVGSVFPGVEQLGLAGGLTAKTSGSWSPKGWHMEATVRPAGVTLAWGESVRLTRLTGEFPLLLERDSSTPAGERFSTLQWDEFRAGPIGSAGGELRLAAEPNRWQLAAPLRLAATGGWLELISFTLALPATGPTAQASLRATGIEMVEISRQFDWPAMGGQLGAELSDIRFAGNEIRTGGEARLQVFDGAVRLRNMRVRNPFSDYPTYHADIDFSGIDLRLLTQAFAFGEINGVADGFIHELRLFGAVPSAFQAVFETRETGRRNISVKAIKNLNTLSQGGLSAALSQGIYRFIDFYRYRKIGIRCSLRNDVFHLTGTAKPDTDTYLIHGGWLPPRLDVIVSSPSISFQEMVRRLKRIERAGR